jgi:hypothetical protein
MMTTPQIPELPDNLRDALPLIGKVIADFGGNAPPVTIDEAARDCKRAAEVLFMVALGAHEMRDRIEQTIQRMTDIAVTAADAPRKEEVIASWREQLAEIDTALCLREPPENESPLDEETADGR